MTRSKAIATDAIGRHIGPLDKSSSRIERAYKASARTCAALAPITSIRTKEERSPGLTIDPRIHLSRETVYVII